MVLRRIVPYATVDEKRDVPFTEDLELASIFVLAEARREAGDLSAIARVYYPFHIHRFEGGVLLIDRLGLNHASIKYRVVPDVDGFKRAIEAAADPEALREVLRERGDLFKDFAGRRTIRIDGLIVRPGMSKELSELLAEAMDSTADEPVVFEPVLKSRDIESIIGSLHSLRGEIEGDLRRLEEAKRSLRDALNTSRKTLKEEIRSIWARGAEVRSRMREEFKEARARRGEALELERERIRGEYRRKAAPFLAARTNLRRRLLRRRRKLEQLEAEGGGPAAGEGIRREIEELEAGLEEAESAIRSLRSWRDTEVRGARARYEAAVKSLADKIREEEDRSRGEIRRIKAEIAELEAAAREVAARIDRLIRSKRSKLRSLSRLRFEVEADTGDLYIPFYIFHYGGKRFDFHPPVMASSAKGFLSRFKRILADNLESKMTQLIKPRSGFLEKHLARAVRSLGRGRGPATAFKRAGDRLNLLRSREAVDKIMVGLVKIRREGWISDGEYIRLQEALVENLCLISRR